VCIYLARPTREGFYCARKEGWKCQHVCPVLRGPRGLAAGQLVHVPAGNVKILEAVKICTRDSVYSCYASCIPFLSTVVQVSGRWRSAPLFRSRGAPSRRSIRKGEILLA
jgi:hypothetical protein